MGSAIVTSRVPCTAAPQTSSAGVACHLPGSKLPHASTGRHPIPASRGFSRLGKDVFEIPLSGGHPGQPFPHQFNVSTAEAKESHAHRIPGASVSPNFVNPSTVKGNLVTVQGVRGTQAAVRGTRLAVTRLAGAAFPARASMTTAFSFLGLRHIRKAALPLALTYAASRGMSSGEAASRSLLSTDVVIIGSGPAAHTAAICGYWLRQAQDLSEIPSPPTPPPKLQK